jgi:hypothetical protein
MYSQHMIRLYRSPEGGEGGAGSEGAPAGDSGAAAGAGAAESGAAGGQAPQYVSKSDFDAFASRFEQTLSRFNQPSAKSEPAKAGEPKEPNLDEYDFKKPGELNRYNRDNYKWLRSLEKAEEAETNAKTEREASIRKNESGHLQRVQDYRKSNPEFDADMKRAGNILVVDEVKHAIFASKNSAAVQHYMAKNPGAADDLNLTAQTEGLEAVRERIGEMAAEMRRTKESQSSTEAAARVRVPRQNLRGGSSSGNRTPSNAERFERFNDI